MAPKLGGFGRVGVGPLAAGIVSAPTEEALPAGNCEGHNDTVADLQLPVGAPDLDHLAHGFVADDVAALHAWNHSVVDMQIGTADGAGRDLDDGVARILDFRVGHRLVAHVAPAVPAQGFHLLVSSAWPNLLG